MAKKNLSVEETKRLPNGLKNESVVLLLTDTDTGSRRSVEVVGAAGHDPAATGDLQELWAQGAAVSELEVERTKSAKREGYYRKILRGINEVREASGSLDAALAAAQVEIARNQKAAAEFAQLQMWFGLQSPADLNEKRQLLLLIQNFALTGLAQGAL